MICTITGHWKRHDKAKVIIERAWGGGGGEGGGWGLGEVLLFHYKIYLTSP